MAGLITSWDYANYYDKPRQLWDSLERPSPEPFDSEMLLRIRNRAKVKAAFLVSKTGLINVPPGLDEKERAQFTRFVWALKRPMTDATVFSDDFVSCRADLIEPGLSPDAITLTSIGASTSPRDANAIAELAFTVWGARQAGYTVEKINLVSIDSAPKEPSETSPSVTRDWIRITDVTADVEAQIPMVDGRLQTMRAVVASKTQPEWSEPELSATSNANLRDLTPERFESPRPESLIRVSKARLADWKEAGFTTIDEIPPNQLSEPQRNQAAALGEGTSIPGTSRGQVADWISEIEFPVAFYDFETVASALPVTPGSRPYQQVPFLAVVATVASPGSQPKVDAVYIEPGHPDPFGYMLESLRPHLEAAETTVAYSSQFEHGVLRDCVKTIGHENPAAAEVHRPWVEGAIQKNKDLHKLFLTGLVYGPEQKGRTSLKKTCATLLESTGYEECEIRDGSAATYAYLSEVEAMTRGAEPNPSVETDLIRYCQNDTLVMASMVSELETRVSDEVRFAGCALAHLPKIAQTEQASPVNDRFNCSANHPTFVSMTDRRLFRDEVGHGLVRNHARKSGDHHGDLEESDTGRLP